MSKLQNEKLLEHLYEYDRAMQQINQQFERAWRCAQHLVAEHGQFYESKRPIKKYGYGQPKMCYNNSMRLALKHELIYVEGFAMQPRLGYAFPHAWCVDPEEPTRAIDITTDVFRAYRGLPFERSFALQEWSRTEFASLLDNWRDNYPMLDRTDFRDIICGWQPKETKQCG